MSTHQIHVFISHAWDYSEHYDTLYEWIFGESWRVGQTKLNFQNFSVPKNDPIHNSTNNAHLQTAIFSKIKRSHVIVIPTGMYATHSKWIQKEIYGAQSYGKQILAVTPWKKEREASKVKRNADAHVGWNKKPVVKAIWDLYRGNL